jgi:RluA family pseudouridine synthase
MARPLTLGTRAVQLTRKRSRHWSGARTAKRLPPLSADEIQTRVLYRDGLILVIDKPAGLAVHAGPSGAPNLEECFDALRFGLPRPPALAHRLDADTSGVLVLGRHPKALRKLGRLFESRETEKVYWAIVQGAPPAQEGVFEQKLLKVNTKSGWWVKASDEGQTALTRYCVLGRGRDITWLELAPETGRTHQLRVHCAAAHCPIVGDRLYGDARRDQMLHLHARSITLPLSRSKPPVLVTAPPPQHMVEALAACGYINLAP